MKRLALAVAAAALLAAASAFLARAEEQLPAGLEKRGGGFVWKRDGSAMVLVPEGRFTMGAETSWTTEDTWAMPGHERELEAYYIDVHEVTNAQYVKFLRAIAADGHATCPPDEPKAKDHRPDDWGTPRYAERSATDDHPVCGVDWWDARAYAAWAGKRLPTEAEWERAARGDGPAPEGEGSPPFPFPWLVTEPLSKGPLGAAAVDSMGIVRANWKGDADEYPRAAPVGKFPQGRSPFGCHDMAGNVWEWVDGPFELYPGAYESVAKTWPPERRQGLRVYRGGSYFAGTMDIQFTHRHTSEALGREEDRGFRCALSAVPAKEKK